MPQLREFVITRSQRLTADYGMLAVTPATAGPLPEFRPGQFVQVQVPRTPGVMLRRPISVHDFDGRELSLLIRRAGRGTASLTGMGEGESLSLVAPLGNGFSLPDASSRRRPLLVGGGVGVAPLLYLGRKLKAAGVEPVFLLGARSKADLLCLDAFESVGEVYVSTDDGSAGSPGVVTLNPALARGGWDMIYCCGPAPMMKAVAAIARERGVECEVSLENMMACGIGACLCCVEKTVKGNVCVCTEGPVFNIKQLTW